MNKIEKHVILLTIIAVVLFALDWVIPFGWFWGFTPVYGLMYSLSLLPFCQNQSKAKIAAFVIVASALSMLLAFVSGLHSASHSPVVPNANNYFTYTSIQKFMIGSSIGAIILAGWIRFMILPKIKSRIFIYAPIFTLVATLPMLLIEELGYWAWFANVVTWWICFTIALTFSFEKQTNLGANKSLKHGTAQSAAP